MLYSWGQTSIISPPCVTDSMGLFICLFRGRHTRRLHVQPWGKCCTQASTSSVWQVNVHTSRLFAFFCPNYSLTSTWLMTCRRNSWESCCLLEENSGCPLLTSALNIRGETPFCWCWNKKVTGRRIKTTVVVVVVNNWLLFVDPTWKNDAILHVNGNLSLVWADHRVEALGPNTPVDTHPNPTPPSHI